MYIYIFFFVVFFHSFNIFQTFCDFSSVNIILTVSSFLTGQKSNAITQIQKSEEFQFFWKFCKYLSKGQNLFPCFFESKFFFSEKNLFQNFNHPITHHSFTHFVFVHWSHVFGVGGVILGGFKRLLNNFWEDSSGPEDVPLYFLTQTM